MLRVTIDAGGCSGYRVDFTFTDKLDEAEDVYVQQQ